MKDLDKKEKSKILDGKSKLKAQKKQKLQEALRKNLLRRKGK